MMNKDLREWESIYNQIRPHRLPDNLTPQEYIQSTYSQFAPQLSQMYSGQNSTYYGKIEDLALSQEYITPQGALRTPAYPRCATGPDYNQIMIGSEGARGAL